MAQQKLLLGHVKGDKGDSGTPGSPGKDGVSVTHEWEGTTLKVTSASGTTSADLQGPEGPRGLEGPTGPEGPRGPEGPKGDTGEGLKVLDTYRSIEDLTEAHPSGDNPGDAYIVSDHYYTWNGNEWKDAGTIQGPAGPAGPAGATGPAGVPGKDGMLYRFRVDDEGNMYVVYNEADGAPKLRIDTESGGIYGEVGDAEILIGKFPTYGIVDVGVPGLCPPLPEDPRA